MDRITNDEVFQRVKEEILLLKNLENRCHSWIGHTIRHNKFVVNILERSISRKKAMGRPLLQYLEEDIRQEGWGTTQTISAATLAAVTAYISTVLW